MWQTEPEFLERPVEEWPISQECVIEVKSLLDVAGLMHHVKKEFTINKNSK
jgi:hypothetical protein